MPNWIDACAADDVENEDLVRFDHGTKTFAIYRSHKDEYFCTDGLCTHEQVHLSDGLVMDYIIECPKHNGRFDYRTGEAKGAPVCVDLKTYPAELRGGRIFVKSRNQPFRESRIRANELPPPGFAETPSRATWYPESLNVIQYFWKNVQVYDLGRKSWTGYRCRS